MESGWNQDGVGMVVMDSGWSREGVGMDAGRSRDDVGMAW